MSDRRSVRILHVVPRGQGIPGSPDPGIVRIPDRRKLVSPTAPDSAEAESSPQTGRAE
jgi:hypothetical protein